MDLRPINVYLEDLKAVQNIKILNTFVSKDAGVITIEFESTGFSLSETLNKNLLYCERSEDLCLELA